MSNKLVSKSFRLPEVDVQWLKEFANNKGINQTEIISQALAMQRLNEGRDIALGMMKNGGITEDESTINFLQGLGIAGVSGFAGYHISGMLRKQLDMDEDKGSQMIFGLLAGLGSLVISGLISNAKNK
jgi:hypothetical protein